MSYMKKRVTEPADSEPRARHGRRAFIAGAAAMSATVALGQDRNYGPGAPPVRYPDPDIVVLDKRFAKYKIGNTPIQRLFTGTLWASHLAALPTIPICSSSPLGVATT